MPVKVIGNSSTKQISAGILKCDRLARVAGLLALALLTSSCAPDSPELLLVGTVERTAVELVAPVSEVITEVAVVRGARVAPGQVLVRLDPTLAEAEVARVEAQLASAVTADRVAAAELTRLFQLRRDKVASEQALERAELEREEAAAKLRQARAQLAAAQKKAADLALASPLAGVVDQIPFELGERVPAGAVLAVLLVDRDPWVRIWVPEKSAAFVAPGTPAWIAIDGVDRTLAGKVLDVAREPAFTPHYALTERDRVHLVYESRVGILDAPPGLRPGLPADVTLRLDVGVIGEAAP